MRNRAAPRSKRPSAEQPGSTLGSLTKDPPAPGKNMWKLSAKMRMNQNLRIVLCLGGWTSINPSYLGATPRNCPTRAQLQPRLLPQIQRPVPTFFGLPSFAASRALHSAVRFIAPRHSRCGLGVLAADQTPQGATAGEPTHVGAIGHQAAWGLVVMVLLQNGSLW